MAAACRPEERLMSSTSVVKRSAKLFLCLGFFLAGWGPTAFAQEEAKPAATADWKKKPVFTFKLGGFFPSVSMQARVDRADGEGTDIDVENDLGLDKNGTTVRLDGDIRIASWFSLGMDYYGFRRDGDSKVIDKEIQIGDTVFPVHQTLQSSLATQFGNLDLKFYIIHRERLDFGVYAGVYLTRLKIRVEAQERGTQLLEIRKFWAPIPSIGLHFWYQPVNKLFVYAKAGYFDFNPNKHSKFQSATGSLNLDYYFYRFLGVGARYEYSKMKVEIDRMAFDGQVDYDISGAQVYLVLGF